MTRKDIEAEIVRRAWADGSFKRDLLQNPKQVLEAEVARMVEGFRFPEKMQVEVLEETAEKIVLVLPVQPASVAGALKDEDLAKVNGGAGAPEGMMFGASDPLMISKGMGGFGITVGPTPLAW